MERIKVKDFEIRCEYTGSRISSNPYEVYYYIVYKPTGKRIADTKFYKKADATRWLSRTVEAANNIRR